MSPEQLFKVSLGYDKNKQFITDSSKEYLSKSISVQLETVYRFDFFDGKYTLTAGVANKREHMGSSHRDENEHNTGNIQSAYHTENMQNEYDTKRDTRTAFTELIGTHDLTTYRVIVRADDLSGNKKEQVFTWSGVASYHVAEIMTHNIFMKGGFHKGFRDPGFDEQYNLFEDSDLDIEEAVTHEIGLRIEKKIGSYFLDVSVLETEITEPNLVSLVRKELSEKAYIKGVEMQAGIIFGDWDGQVNYTTLDADTTNLPGTHEVIKHLGSIKVNRALTPDWNIGTELVFKKWADSSFADESNVLDVFLIRNMNENLEIGYAIRNITDEQYDIGLNTEGPRRTLELHIAVRF